MDGSEGIVRHIELFRAASVIVGAHGAMVKNLIFCSEGTRVIEFFSDKYVNTCYKSTANLMNLEYESIETMGDKDNNIKIPLRLLNYE